MTTELPKTYQPGEHETRIRERWEKSRAFHAEPSRVSASRKPYTILIPPPNVTAALHLGHALNNTLQDVLARAHRMMGFETLWMPGTDHAGIATQTVVEKRLISEGKPARIKWERDAFVEQVQKFKDEYEAVITGQLKAMGCSCDWDRQRFTMDEVCARAVREAFFRLFQDGLIYRGKRLVNWDPVTQTVLADDEVEMEEVDGFFYYLRYPLCDASGKPLRVPMPDGTVADHVTVATTRPETYLGDTAVAVNPKDPRWPALSGAKAFVRLPLVTRVIPIVADDYVVMPAAMQADPEAAAKDPKAAYATGFLKVTPAHDTNDYEIGQRHSLPIINVMAPDASISDKHGWTDVHEAVQFVGMPREDARKAVVTAFKNANLLEAQKPYKHSVGHSYRSHAAIEPYLSDQWYIAVKKQIPSLPDAGMIKGTDVPAHSLAGLALQPLLDGKLRFVPERYAKTYQTWLENLRDWPISRQLWWGHRIPVWTMDLRVRDRWSDEVQGAERRARLEVNRKNAIDAMTTYLDEEGHSGKYEIRRDHATLTIACKTLGCSAAFDILQLFFDNRIRPWLESQALRTHPFSGMREYIKDAPEPIKPPDMRESRFNAIRWLGSIQQDPDVLDTWFSSGLWPLSTMGWPDSAQSDETRGVLEVFNPTNVLCTAREIITLWVSRMVMFNRYFLAKDGKPGPAPFHDVFIHSVIQDGEGRKMSKSLGNGVDPLDIISSHGADAMRFTLCHMTTQTQDVRMPVERDERTGKNTSPKFDLGRNFCNKLWNASRFALAILDSSPGASAGAPVDPKSLTLADRWILSRLASATKAIDECVQRYEYADYAAALYDLLWRDFCDWYLEAIKPTVKGDTALGAGQRAVLRATLDAILRLLHPVAPYITEAIYERLREVRTAEVKGLMLGMHESGLLCLSGWPEVNSALRDEEAEQRFERLRTLTESVREARAKQNVAPKRKLTLHVDKGLAEAIGQGQGLVETLAGLEKVTTEAPPSGGGSMVITFEGAQRHISGLTDEVDAGAERARLEKKVEDLSKSIAALEGRLNNPGYADKAPAKLVQQTRDQLTAQQAELSATRDALGRLG